MFVKGCKPHAPADPNARTGCLTVRARQLPAPAGVLEGFGLRFPAALGRVGRRALKREGDGAAPLGRFRLLAVLYRADRLRRPRTALPLRRIRPDDGWCDAPDDRNYNRPVRLPYPASAETLWREDHLYDVLVVLDVNLSRRARGRGSAVFLHCAAPGLDPTEGCIALARPNLLGLLTRLRPGTVIRIG